LRMLLRGDLVPVGNRAVGAGGVFVGGEAAAKRLAELGALARDRDFIKRYLAGDHEATVKMKTLHAAAHG
jgi:hypothetical protein